MKKKFKKLSLTTETLRHLAPSSLREAVGADTIESQAITKCITRECSFCTAICSECTIQCTPCCIP